MKHIKDFQSLVAAKAATLYSPLVVNVTDSGTSKMLIKSDGNKEMQIDQSITDINDLSSESVIERVTLNYLTFTCIEAGGISMSHYGTNVSATKPNIQYSKNGGEWIDNWDGTNISLVAGDIVKMKGINPNGINVGDDETYYENYSQFTMTGKIAASGNIMSLIDGEKNGTKVIPGTGYCFYNLFYECRSLITPPELPATTLSRRCYLDMFAECQSLISAPKLPALILTNNCYSNMFNGCYSLTSAPELPATTLDRACYWCMFSDCTSLTIAPKLPATTLAINCYAYMFTYCTSLTTAPVLPATTLAKNCYKEMFYGCTNLSYIKCLATDISAEGCTEYWVSGVSPTGTFVKNSAKTWSSGSSGIPTGWTVQDA